MSPSTLILPTLLLTLQALAIPTPTTPSPTVTITERAPAAGGVVTAGNLATYAQSNIYDGIGPGSDSYTAYGCSANSNWPSKSSWVSFVDMFNANKPLMFSSCSNIWGLPNVDGPEVGAIWDSIQQVAGETGVDHRFILAVMMQESKGCVRAPTSNYGVRNPGLMQSHNGDGTCNSDYTGQIQTPCPTGVITEMIREGAAGTTEGDGLAQAINEASWGGAKDAMAIYTAARIYNSGSVGQGGCLEAGIATHCYASDIANRLTGWVWAGSSCRFDG